VPVFLQYDAISCPEGHYKVGEEEFLKDRDCDAIGVTCPEGTLCYCKPCVKAFEVDVYEHSNGEGDDRVISDTEQGCDKMDLCGTVEQTKTMVFRAVDNLRREGAVLKAVVHMDHLSAELPVTKVSNDSYTYEFDFAQDTIGVGILEVFVDSEQIPESPFRVQVTQRDCETEYPGKGKTAVGYGLCLVRSIRSIRSLAHYSGLAYFPTWCTPDRVRLVRVRFGYHLHCR
jgi:hypothetical protein